MEEHSIWEWVIPALAVIAGVIIQVLITWITTQRARRQTLQDRFDAAMLNNLRELAQSVSRYYTLASMVTTEKITRDAVAPGFPLESLTLENLAQIGETATNNDVLAMRIGDTALENAVALMHAAHQFEHLPPGQQARDQAMADFREARNRVVKRIGVLERSILEREEIRRRDNRRTENGVKLKK